MDKYIERIKDMGSTIPGLILSFTALIALFKDYAQQLIKMITDLGYTWNPDPTTIALMLIFVIGIKMILFEGNEKAKLGSKENPIELKDEIK